MNGSPRLCPTIEALSDDSAPAGPPRAIVAEIARSPLSPRPIGIIEGEGSLGSDSLEDVLPEMIKEACLAGGDALILTSSQKAVTVSGDLDFLSSDEELHTVATVIVWTDED